MKLFIYHFIQVDIQKKRQNNISNKLMPQNSHIFYSIKWITEPILYLDKSRSVEGLETDIIDEYFKISRNRAQNQHANSYIIVLDFYVMGEAVAVYHQSVTFPEDYEHQSENDYDGDRQCFTLDRYSDYATARILWRACLIC